ncbi:hypothetical protein ACFQXB_08635 [Plastorhodobacter daqingensis]|uniref:DUF2336 domain-containing protein n=1 Tax=Plastorhodobacter daqingensis TaxID=1387281 RepID=A0ABW2UJY7_9RHOB
MQDKTLDRAEQDLLSVIRDLHAEKGAFDRDVLLVVARGRGLEVGRALGRLRALGLVEEIERRPFLLRRLFGARTRTLLQPVARPEAPEAEPAAPQPDQSAVAASTPVAEAPPAAATDPMPPSDEATPGASGLAIAAAEDQPATAPTTPTTGSDHAVPPQHPDLPADPRAAPPKDQPRAPSPLPRPARPTAAERAAASAYTEELGGTPAVIVTPAPAIDPALLESLREVIEGLGMEMTMAGDALVAHRIARGDSAAEALSQLVLYAFAHAVRHDIISNGAVQALGLTDYAVEVMREIEKLRDAGEIGDARFEEDMRRLWALVSEGEEQARLAEELLSDPMGGAAPPALLPEELRQGGSGPDQDEDYF